MTTFYEFIKIWIVGGFKKKKDGIKEISFSYLSNLDETSQTKFPFSFKVSLLL
jgi:hypothetical protein